jgi:uncharacterized protein (TIGR03032 family)
MSKQNIEPEQKQPDFEINASRQFMSWLIEQNISLGFSTYQSGKVFLIGHNPDQSLSVFERTFNRPMGLWTDGDVLWLSTLYQLYRFKNSLPTGANTEGYDRLFVPQKSYMTADIDVHDIAPVDSQAAPIFVNTLFSCLATVSDDYSFKALWQPSFISELAPEDRCHLNGLALRDGLPAYVTAISTTNVADGWRDHRHGGGVVMDVASNQVIAQGFSMPHSPRWAHDKLWVANSGAGEFGYIDMDTGKFEVVAFCPGYIRGVTIVGDYAVVGLSKPRHKTFQGLPLDARLTKENIGARCGLYVVDLIKGGTPHWLTMEGLVTELYDVVSLADVARPSMIGFRNDQIRRVISLEP